MTTLGIAQARFGSSRLPGKVLEPIGGTPMLRWSLDRLAAASTIDRVVLATTTERSDDPVARLAEDLGFEVVRGSVFDVLDRFHDALQAHPDADVIVRITADCPFLDPALVDDVVDLLRRRGADFASNRLPPPFPRTYPVGLDVEACTRAALETAWRDATAKHHREHVMPYLYESTGLFSVALLDLEEDLSSYRWTVDTPRDLAAARAIADRLTPGDLSWRSILAIVGADPALRELNAMEEQKTLGATDTRWAAGANRDPSRGLGRRDA